METTFAQIFKVVVVDETKKWFLNLPRYLQKTWVLGGIGFAIIFFAALAYILRFGWIPIDDHEKWGQFGDFLGGTTNPILAFLTFIGVLWTIGLNHEELKNNAKTAARQAVTEQKETIYKIIERIYLETKEILAIPASGYPPQFSISLRCAIEESMASSNIREAVRKNNFPSFLTLHDLLTQLRFYLNKYDELAGDQLLSAYYRRYFVVVALNLNHLEVIPDELREYYETFTVYS